jgi:hypothetical protein
MKKKVEAEFQMTAHTESTHMDNTKQELGKIL